MKAPFDALVREQIDRLQRQSLRQIEVDTIARRTAWLRQHKAGVGPRRPLSPRAGFEQLFFEYMGLMAEDLLVVKETPDEIAWLSRNPCPTLEACQQLGLDTRLVCRGAVEKPTQAFLSFLDPHLRFFRSYEEIRPFAGYCLERIVRVDFAACLALAVEQAMRSRLEGNQGHGAVVTYAERLLSQAGDTRQTEHDPSRHAVVNAIRQAVAAQGDSNLSGAILFATHEPCPMCAGLAVQANLTAIVYGVSDEPGETPEDERAWIGVREIIERSPATVEVFQEKIMMRSKV